MQFLEKFKELFTPLAKEQQVKEEEHQLLEQKQIEDLSKYVTAFVNHTTPDDYNNDIYQKIVNHASFEKLKNFHFTKVIQAPYLPDGEYHLKNGSLLHFVCLMGHLELAEDLVERGINTRTKDDLGNTAAQLMACPEDMSERKKQYFKSFITGHQVIEKPSRKPKI